MGQKTHPFFFRACLDGSDWNSKYIEKTSEESALLLYKDLNISLKIGILKMLSKKISALHTMLCLKSDGISVPK